MVALLDSRENRSTLILPYRRIGGGKLLSLVMFVRIHEYYHYGHGILATTYGVTWKWPYTFSNAATQRREISSSYVSTSIVVSTVALLFMDQYGLLRRRTNAGDPHLALWIFNPATRHSATSSLFQRRGKNLVNSLTL